MLSEIATTGKPEDGGEAGGVEDGGAVEKEIASALKSLCREL
jgi:hypothetical protein